MGEPISRGATQADIEGAGSARTLKRRRQRQRAREGQGGGVLESSERTIPFQGRAVINLGESLTTQDLYDGFDEQDRKDFYNQAVEKMDKVKGRFKYQEWLQQKFFEKLGAKAIKDILHSEGMIGTISVRGLNGPVSAVTEVGIDSEQKIALGIDYLQFSSQAFVKDKLKTFRRQTESVRNLSQRHPPLIMVVPTDVGRDMTPNVPGVTYIQLPITSKQLGIYTDLIYRHFKPEDNAPTLAELFARKSK